ncbi:DUF1684 domain-containing protein [Arthrobacter cryoconiti]|uniref:DUF1684 domain-containing protein n=1 Tax=Arthrobacter cryoconiti TaxID=748907 RepID=A0ABV8QVL4_9MICC|nr:DUF1684 domain-containing protein [Arthrobacter cryoconiti]MCC9069530.1 DUF1684 domain-containing protein [Arthrobacter cryoconiti]
MHEKAKTTKATTATSTLDWRLRTFELYSEVRALMESGDRTGAHALWIRQRNSLFATHAASALDPEKKKRFRGLRVSDYDANFSFESTLLEEGAGEEMLVRTGTDGSVPFERIGTFRIPGIGSLAAWQLRSYGGGIFLPFRDAGSGQPGGSYGAGRYLLDTIKGAFLGRVGDAFILDFNFAYNPSCAYDETWACPLPGPHNRLATEISVGELYLPELAP